MSMQATFVRHRGRRDRVYVTRDDGSSDLVRAEEAVALLGPTAMHVDEVGALAVARLDAASNDEPDGAVLRSGTGFDLPAGVTEEQVASVRRRLIDLSERRRRFDDGDAITLPYTGRSSGPTPAQGR